MQHSIVENTIRENMFKRGETDACRCIDLDENNSTILIQAKKLVKDNIAECKGKLNSLKKKLENILSKKDKVNSDIKESELEIKSSEYIWFPKVLLFRVIPGIIYVIGDVMFSKTLIAMGWGIGNAGPFEIWILAIAIGLAPFFVKDIIDRFIEPYLESKSTAVRRVMHFIYISLGISFIAAFIQIAILRYIIFKYDTLGSMNLNTDNAFQIIFNQHEGIMMGSFILTAFMFVVGGGFLMSVGMKDVSYYMKYYKENRQKKTLEAKLRKYDQEETILTQEIMQLEAYQYDESRYETFLHSVSEELKYAYIEGYHSEQKKIQNVEQNTRLEIEKRDLRIKELELIQKTKSNETVKQVPKNVEMETLTDNFDVYVRSLLIEKANKLNSGGYNND